VYTGEKKKKKKKKKKNKQGRFFPLFPGAHRGGWGGPGAGGGCRGPRGCIVWGGRVGKRGGRQHGVGPPQAAPPPVSGFAARGGLALEPWEGGGRRRKKGVVGKVGAGAGTGDIGPPDRPPAKPWV